MIQQYINYIKDNPKGYWFKAKWYGWGWTPARWQGFLVLGVYVVLVLSIGFSADANSHSVSDTLYGVTLPFLVLTAVLLAICWKKGERPHWSWGPKSKKK